MGRDGWREGGRQRAHVSRDSACEERDRERGSARAKERERVRALEAKTERKREREREMREKSLRDSIIAHNTSSHTIHPRVQTII